RLATPRGAPSWGEGRGLWPHLHGSWGTIGFTSSFGSRSSASLSRDRHLRVVHRRRLALAGAETGDCLQHPVAQTAETGMVPRGLDRSVRPPSTAEDQAEPRSTIPPRQ